MSRTLHLIVCTALLWTMVGTASAAEAPNFCDWTGPWAPAGAMSAKRDRSTATVLQDGRVLVVGGYDGASTVAFAEVYDPATATFTMAGSLATDRADHAAVLLPDGRVLVAGGIRIANGVFAGRLASAEIFNPATGNFTPASPMHTDRQFASGVPLSTGKVLL